jgi:4-aminobutyrate aminotransferase|tara:strand:+ start:192 stop:443 length:252 start_codon:yes stop_codon:yes gene_type:complete
MIKTLTDFVPSSFISMIGLEFEPDAPEGINKLVSQACFENGMLLLPASVYPTIRFIPPLTVSDDEIEMGLNIFEKSLKEVLER